LLPKKNHHPSHTQSTESTNWPVERPGRGEKRKFLYGSLMEPPNKNEGKETVAAKNGRAFTGLSEEQPTYTTSHLQKEKALKPLNYIQGPQSREIEERKH